MHLLIDGMNVIGSRPDGWWRDRPGAMRRLVSALDDFARETTDQITVVFDGRPIEPPAEAVLVEVVFAPGRGRGAADDEIARLVGEASDPASIRVVTSDEELAGRVREHRAEVEGAGTFRRRLAAV